MSHVALDEKQWPEFCQGLRDRIDFLEPKYAELQQRALDVTPDGYRRQSIPESGSVTNEVDEDGVPVPQHSDPTANAVLGRDGRNPDRDAMLKVTLKSGEAKKLLDEAKKKYEEALAVAAKNVAKVERILAEAESTVRKCEPPMDVPKLDPAADVFCEHHRLFGIMEPRGHRRKNAQSAAALCKYCDEFFAAEGIRPTKRILEWRAQGRRVSAAMVEEEKRRVRT